MKQTYVSGHGSFVKLANLLSVQTKVLLVCGKSVAMLPFYDEIRGFPIPVVKFSGFSPNPCFEDIGKGLDLFLSQGCDSILAVGGGSAIDVAKCIKLYSGSDVPLIAIPTTAGSGSESTKFAVIYRNGEKQSVEHNSILPNIVILEPSALTTLPIYQKKCTLLDALCQAIESWWSVSSTEDSKKYSALAIVGLVKNMDAYFSGDASVIKEIMQASNYSGCAINNTRTTAPHAMSYKLTTLYNIPHGHAVALCLPKVWQFMLDYKYRCCDIRGIGYLDRVFSEISTVLGASTPQDAIIWFERLLETLKICSPCVNNSSDVRILSSSVDPQRMKNHPVTIEKNDFEMIYRAILNLTSN